MFPRQRRTPLWLATAALVLLMSSAASTQTPAKATGGDNIPDVAYEKYTLDNGLEVILHQDNSVPLVAVSVWYHVGSGDEVPGRSGFAHLFEHMMFQGSKHTGEDAHFSTLQNIGASSINGTTNKDRTNYFEVVPSNQLETALWLESDRMGYMLDMLTEKSFANQRDVVRNERRQRYDNVPFGQERFAVAEALYPEGHPYRYLTIGRHEDLEAASIEDVRNFFTMWYVPSNATIAIGGDFTLPEAKAAVEKWFGTFPKFDPPKRTPSPMPKLDKTIRRTLNDPLAKLSRIHYVWPTPPYLKTGDLDLDIIATVLGANGWGTLNRKLVIEEQLAQSVAVAQYSSGYSSEFHIIVTSPPGTDLKAIESIIQAELDNITTKPLADDVMKRAINVMES
ncbi:MAG: pitrilysin family protein, partial [Myxococcota bacterium]